MSLLKSIAVFLCGLVMLHQSSAQVPNIGSCPKVEVVQGFDAARYLGKWYENQKYFAFFEFGGKCITAEYSATDKPNVVKVFNRQYNNRREKVTTIQGTATLLSDKGEAKLGVEFPSVPFAGVAPYWVLGTDYDSYSVVWSCNDVGGLLNARIAWILTRERKPKQSVLEKAYGVLDANKISRSPLIRTDQSDCDEAEEDEERS